MRSVIAILYLISSIQSYITNTNSIDWFSGSLDGSWTINVTVFMENFGSAIFECVDFEKNSLLLNATKDRNGRNILYLKYNRKYQEKELMSICGCDNCDGRLVKFGIIGTKDTVSVYCNNHGYFDVPRIQVADSDQDSINDYKIYFTIASNKFGCLESLYFNKNKITKFKFRHRFLEECPRQCKPGICNNGICRALYATGPICDCSSTALNGQFCNKEMRKYKKKYINSFRKTFSDNAVEFKLSWRAESQKRYCLIQFVGEYHHVTLSIHAKRLLSGTKKIAEINQDDMNYIEAKLSNIEVHFRVNGKSIPDKLDFVEDIIIHLGFSNTSDSCDTFEGTYDFKSDTSQLRPLRHSRSPFHEVNRRKTFIVVGTSVLSALIIYVLITLLIFLSTRKCFTIKRRKPLKPVKEFDHEEMLDRVKPGSRGNLYDENYQYTVCASAPDPPPRE